MTALSGPVRCPCGWTDGDTLLIDPAPYGGWVVYGDEGMPVGFCKVCDGELDEGTVIGR